jgi:hypothetical protein
VLQPRSVVEIGVRYGYSALAFLDACPEATYLGIDNDSSHSGGVVGAVDRAREAMRDRRAEVLIADSQTLAALPGPQYDLAHVDGRQDGAGTWRDLALVFPACRYILVDGFFWTRTNYEACSEFLLRHRDCIEWFASVPFYGGELLIRKKDPLPRLPERDPAWLASLFENVPLPALESAAFRLEPSSLPSSLTLGESCEIAVTLQNLSPYRVSPFEPRPLHLAYHWLDNASRRTLVFEGQRTALPERLAPGESVTVKMRITAPAAACRAVLRVTLVQEGVRWMDESGLYRDLPAVEVRG